jgi:hypothetical protein
MQKGQADRALVLYKQVKLRAPEPALVNWTEELGEKMLSWAEFTSGTTVVSKVWWKTCAKCQQLFRRQSEDLDDNEIAALNSNQPWLCTQCCKAK